MNNWKNIWDKREDNLAEIDLGDTNAVFSELKRVDGFDLEGGIPIESLLTQFNNTMRELELKKGDSVFEVGAGSGANLFLFAKQGLSVGGLDYSEKLLAILRRVVPSENLLECIHAEAKDLPTDKKYDAVFSNGVFVYFSDLSYAKTVMEKMLAKSKGNIGVLDVYDEAKKDECMAHRKATIPDYEERYKDLPKLFYPREFFEGFAREHDLDVKFCENELTVYGNAPFMYHCYMRRKS